MIDDWRMAIRWLKIVLLLTCSATVPALAQGLVAQGLVPTTGSPGEAAAVTSPQGSPQAGASGAAKAGTELAPAVDQNQALYLVRATLLTLNDANRSGNYTVLRDLAAPDFQAKNTAADLSQIFTDLRRRNFDLFATALLAPQFTTPPAKDASGRLRLTGSFPTRPLQITFDLTFQVVGGEWRLFAISVATPPATQAQSQVNGPPVRPSPGPFFGFRVLSGTLGWRW
jgi:hypothetical protein